MRTQRFKVVLTLPLYTETPIIIPSSAVSYTGKGKVEIVIELTSVSTGQTG